jgi:UDP-N-acetylglucosamine 4,6-dehydratase
LTLESKRILITGGSGFLGRHLVSHLLNMPDGPDSVIVFSRGEHAQANMRQSFTDPRLRTFLGDVRDLERLRLAMRGVDVVIHAAALKRVDACESDPYEAIKTNVTGTANVVQACIESGVERAIFISSDKAAAPLNLYGKTKACAESLWLAANVYSGNGGPMFSAVRYGNVAGSTGSVIPLWLEKIREGKPVPITEPDATRFWFTANGAVSLVLETLQWMRGGELVVPKLPSFAIGDLAAALGATSETIGPREGDKPHEDMIAEEERPRFNEEPALFVAGAHDSAWPKVCARIPYRSGRQRMLTVAELKNELVKAGLIKKSEYVFDDEMTRFTLSYRPEL